MIKLHWIDHSKFNNENVLQSRSKEDGHPLFNKIMNYKRFQKFCVLMIEVQKN